MKLRSVAVALPLPSANASPIADAEDTTATTLETRSVNCRFKHYGWKNVKCFMQGGDWEHFLFKVGQNTAINAKNLDMTTCSIQDIPSR